ncbi:MarR family EPS-associated transcriptional regulator [Candidatus Pelagibacter sp.]|nr:MarR family EPS-associated transcriptional regulator [Candidatus Pelagibacter sp.]
MDDKEKYFNVLRKIDNRKEVTQRELAKEVGYSLGKMNYCLKALQEKGFIKIKHFKRNLRRNPNKINYLYTLTTKGIAEKTSLTVNFMKKKMKEYDQLKKELNNLKGTDKK